MPATAKIVLSIDDEPTILYLRDMVLKSAGYEVLSALSGREGLELFDSHTVDLVLLDYYMPEMNGAEVAAEMKRRKPNVPIIIVSAYIEVPDNALALAESFVTKGEGPEVLLTRIGELLSLRALRRRTRAA